ncbi:MAG: alpha-L-rhamnosidase N-terminal domain-containing protein, partial [Planctomycetaceae bacterium]|nr:alpha-L-rhamnosidase N-terminal domain-containing protein [Planctomycetaceae bacterium]
MRTILLTFSTLLLLGPAFGISARAAELETQKPCSIRPVNLRVESLTEPEGLDEKTPRFSWTLEPTDPNAKGQKQTAYKIVVNKFLGFAENAKNPANFWLKEMVWDSGWVESDQMQQIEYQGKPLESNGIYWWTVVVKDENDIPSKWKVPTFLGLPLSLGMSAWCTGLLEQSEWTAKWIGSDEIFDHQIGMKKGDCNVNDPWLRKTFELKKKPGRTFLFLASVGYHELYVNGERVDDRSILAPAATDHTKRARYVVYDISSELKPGKNVIAIWLGSSWSVFPGYQTPDLPRTPIVCAQADIYENWSDEKPGMRLQTDETWKTHPSPNKLLGTWDFGNMGGEIYDANREVPDWNAVGFDDSSWKNVTVYQPKLQLTAQRVERNHCFDEIKPVVIE